MVTEGQLIRPETGLYQTNPSMGVGEVIEPFRVQNVRLVAEEMDGLAIRAPVDLVYLPRVGYVEEVVFPGLGLSRDDEVRFRFQVGSKRGKLTFTVRAPLGLTLYGWQFAMWWKDQVACSLGFNGSIRWFVDRGTEWLKDVLGVDLDSMSKSMMLESYEGHIMKMYQKTYGVRGEYKLDSPTSLDAVQATLMGGLPAGYLMNSNAQAIQEMQKQSRILQGWSVGADRTQRAFSDYMPELMGAVFKLIDKVDALQKEVKSIKGGE